MSNHSPHSKLPDAGAVDDTGSLKDPLLPMDGGDEVETRPPAKAPPLVLPSCALVALLVNMLYSIPATFLAVELKSQNIGQDMTGYVFGVAPLVSMLTSPLCGYISAKAGGRNLLVCGMVYVGTLTVVFGFMGHNYWAMFAVRALIGSGQACVNVGVSSIIAHYYHGDGMGTAMGLIEIGTSFGVMIGPPFGGLLYQYANFAAPFLFCGGAMLLGSVPVFCIIPSVYVPHKGIERISVAAMFSAVNLGMCLTTVVSMTGFCLLDPTLSVHMEKYLDLSQKNTAGWVGSMFFVCAISYGVAAVSAGALTDRVGSIKCCMFGQVCAAIGFLLLGPVPVPALAISPDTAWLRWATQYLSLVFLATGGAFSVIPTLPYMTKHSKKFGSDGLATVTGLWAASAASGEVLGPVLGGKLVDLIDKHKPADLHGDGFAWTSTILVAAIGANFVLLAVLFVCTSCCGAGKAAAGADGERLLDGATDLERVSE